MMDEKKITQEEFINTTFNTYYRNEDELKAPLVNPQSAVYKAGLRFVSVSSKITNCPFRKSWVESGKSASKHSLLSFS